MAHTLEQLLERNDVKYKIIESIKRTKEINREHVFNFCAINGNVKITELEEGKEHTAEGADECQEYEKMNGAFHTHTKLTKNGDIVPSPRDIIKTVEDDLEFFCIGGNKNGTGIVRCFNKNDMLLEMNAVLEGTNKQVTLANISKAAKHVVGRMLSDKDYLDKHSYTKIYNIGGE